MTAATEKRVAKRVVKPKADASPAAPPAPTEVRKAAPKVTVDDTPAETPEKPEAKEVRKADLPAEAADEFVPETEAPAKPKRTKAEARAIREQNLHTPTTADLERLEQNLVLLDQYGPEVVDQLVEYFSEPFKTGGQLDPSDPGVTGHRIVMWPTPWRRKMESTGVDGKDGKFLKFRRYELSLLADVLINGEKYVTIYPLEGDMASAIPAKEMSKLPSLRTVPADEGAFDAFLRSMASVLASHGGTDLVISPDDDEV